MTIYASRRFAPHGRAIGGPIQLSEEMNRSALSVTCHQRWRVRVITDDLDNPIPNPLVRPEVLKPANSQLCVSHRMLNVLMSQVQLDSSCIVAVIG